MIVGNARGELRFLKSALTTERDERVSVFMKEKAAAAFQRAEGGRVQTLAVFLHIKGQSFFFLDPDIIFPTGRIMSSLFVCLLVVFIW